jgi:hypothetical protein
MRNRRVLLLILIAALAPVPIRASIAANKNTRIASYTMDARLKLDGRGRPSTVEGKARLVWHNDSKDTIPDLQFHLYLNAFKDEKSTFVRESGGQLRGDEMVPGEWGSIELKEMKLGADDLLTTAEFIQPDDDNRNDQTVLRVVPQHAIKPGETITIEMVFVSRLPRVFARTGYWGSFVMVGQWFPKIGVWETAGERRREKAGWNCHQFHADSEFYADFGTYDVTLTVPASYKGKTDGTGDLRSERSNPDGTVTYNFYQEDVHDFGWTADPRFVKVIRKFDPAAQFTSAELTEWCKRLDLEPSETKLSEVEVILLIQPEHRDQIDRHFRAAFNALKYFGLWYRGYPYKTLAIVDPPFNANGAGGMEYPTLITAGTRWKAGRDQNLEDVIVHEIAHQYWYGMVASNEFEESWMDEGMTQYVTAKVLGTAYGNNVEAYNLWGVDLFYWPLSMPHPFEDRMLTLRGAYKDPIITRSWSYYDSSSYGINSYPRTSLALNTLERYLGEATMNRVIRTYFEKWAYQHPASDDFFDIATEVSGKDLTWFFSQYFRGTATLDYELADISSTSRESTGGVKNYDTEVVVRRNGEAWFPVEFRFDLEDGSRIEAIPAQLIDGGISYEIRASGASSFVTWPTHDRWKKFRLVTHSPIRSAEVDPERKVLLDANLTNNSYAVTGGLTAGARWGGSSYFWTQSLFQLLGFLG